MTPEFSRSYRLDSLGGLNDISLEAAEEERTLLARRFGLQAVEELSATASVSPGKDAIDVTGQMRARAVQSCVVTGEPVIADITQAFTIRFVPADMAPEADEVELSADDCDIMEHDGQAIDLGEAIAQTMGLALDPYPRSPGAEARLREAGVLSEGEAGPFGALAALKDKLQGK